MRRCPDALRADLRRFYGLDLDNPGIGALAVADLAANLPRQAVSWARVDPRARWDDLTYLTAMAADRLDFLAWAQSKEASRRGSRWKSRIPYPGRRTLRRAATSGMPRTTLDRILAMPRRPATS